METVGLAKGRSGNAWTGGGGGEKGSLLDIGKQRSGSGGGYGALDSPLATQLQQAWLQTQLPKRNVPKLDYLSPLPSPDYHSSASPDFFPKQSLAPARSSSSTLSHHSPQAPFSPAESFSESTFTNQSDHGSYDHDLASADSDPMDEDSTMLTYLSDMLMEDDIGEKKCMYVQCSAYQAMNQELYSLISDGNASSPSQGDYSTTGDDDFSSGCYDGDRDGVSSWVDEVLNSNPGEYEDDDDHYYRQQQEDDLYRRQQQLQEQQQQQQKLQQPQPQPPLHPKRQVSSVKPGASDDMLSILYGINNMTTHSPRSLTAPSATLATSGDGAIPGQTDGVPDDDCVYLDNDIISRTDYSNGRSGTESMAELGPLLMQCAQAVASDDVRQAHVLINQLRQRVSPYGDGGQRLSYYVVEALVARMSGTGAKLYTALSSNRPSAKVMLEAMRLYVRFNPLPKIAHLLANKTILHAVENVDRIHIIDFGILYGVQWPCLLRRLAEREGGPPHVRITGIDFPRPGFQKNDHVEETGRRLSLQAKRYGVELEYHAIAGKWESIQPAQLNLRNDEMLIVNSMFRLRNLLDETVMASSPRKAVLAKIQSLNPKLFTMGLISAGLNSPFFLARFRETVDHFTPLFDAIHTSVPPNEEMRIMAEKEILGREILNIIACEGTERIERAETYRQWQSRAINAGFKQLPIHEGVYDLAREKMKPYHSGYGLNRDGNWVVSGWKHRVLHAHTAWTCA